MISICVPTYNREQYLMRTLGSILNQTYTDFELIILDDGSKDNTPNLIKKIKDERLKYVRNEKNLGIVANWNKGINLAKGKYVAIYHDHDIYEPTIVEESVRILDSYDNVGMVHTGVHFIDNEENVVSMEILNLQQITLGYEMAKKLSKSWHSPIVSSTAMVRKVFYEKSGGFDPKFPSGDLELWVRLCMMFDIGYIAKPLVSIRGREESHFLAKFSWKNLQNSVESQKINIQRVYQDNTFRKWWEFNKFLWKKNLYYFEHFINLISKNSDRMVIDEGKYIINAECFWWIKALIYFILYTHGIKSLLHNNRSFWVRIYKLMKLSFIKFSFNRYWKDKNV